MTHKPGRQATDKADVDPAVAAQMDECRRRIDELDREIVRMLNARAKYALELGRLKDSVGLDTYQPARERAVLAHARGENHGPLDGDAITRLFERIIDENRRLERLAERDSPDDGDTTDAG